MQGAVIKAGLGLLSYHTHEALITQWGKGPLLKSISWESNPNWELHAKSP